MALRRRKESRAAAPAPPLNPGPGMAAAPEAEGEKRAGVDERGAAWAGGSGAGGSCQASRACWGRWRREWETGERQADRRRRYTEASG